MLVKLEGQRVDKHYTAWLNIWQQLTQRPEQATGYNTMTVGNVAGTCPVNGANAAGATIYTLLQFWFCQRAGLALPLIALQYHEVKVIFQFETLANYFNPRN